MQRLRIYLEPRDIWVGVYVAPQAVYICPLPFVVFRWHRKGPQPIVLRDATDAELQELKDAIRALPVSPRAPDLAEKEEA